jgi:BirA family biotin operon repressor/biotin-[acetyl-CoA-carboxylase] ligase
LPSDLEAALARGRRRLEPVCRQVYWYPEVSSTNDVALSMADAGAPEGTVVIADAQTAGRGRLRRAWASPRGAGLYVSVVLRPDPQWIGLLTLAAGVALADGIAAATGLRPALKWPNDLMVAAAVNSAVKKLAGILAEATARGCVVLGFGINLSAAAYPQEIASRATSLERELGRSVDRSLVLIECMSAFASRYDDLGRGRSVAVLDAWRAHARPLLGGLVEWDAAGGPRRGVAEDVDASGALLVRSDGQIARLIAGDVRWI